MQIRFIDYGTRLDIQVAEDISRTYEEEIFPGIFIGMESGIVTFTIESDALLRREKKLEPGNILRFTFFREASMFVFEGRVVEIAPSYSINRIVVDAMSPIEKSSRRKSHRVMLNIPINIYKTIPGRPNETGPIACLGMTFDISDTGICVTSNEKLDLRDGSNFLAEFTLKGSEIFLMPVLHVRTGSCPQLFQYTYDYAFLFDREKDAEKINKMTLSLFQHVFESRF